MTRLMKLLDLIASLIVPDAAKITTPHPFTKKTKTEKKQTVAKAADVVPDDVSYIAGKAFKTIATPSGFESEAWDVATEARTEAVTTRDINLIAERNLKQTKYHELKRHWAAELSAADTAHLFEGRRGYGKRTIETYFSAMSAAAELTSSPAR